jgi:hypothetical protein
MKKTIYLVVAFLAFGVQPSFGGSNKDCYPGNGSTIDPGSTSTAGEGEGIVSSVESERHGVVTNRGDAKVEIEFNAKINGNNTTGNDAAPTGRASVRIRWKDPTLTGGIEQTEFESGCVAEIQTDTTPTMDNSTPDAEVEYEGTVEDFPGYPGTKKAAVLSVVGMPDAAHPGRVELDFTIELGYTSFENVYMGGDGDIEVGKFALTNLESEEAFHVMNSMGIPGKHGWSSHPDQH